MNPVTGRGRSLSTNSELGFLVSAHFIDEFDQEIRIGSGLAGMAGHRAACLVVQARRVEKLHEFTTILFCLPDFRAHEAEKLQLPRLVQLIGLPVLPLRNRNLVGLVVPATGPAADQEDEVVG
ncbi:hypothetical protein D9M69_661460 [compost metagenome]